MMGVPWRKCFHHLRSPSLIKGFKEEEFYQKNGPLYVLFRIMCGCGSQTIKKAEHWRIDAFQLWHWKRLESSLGRKEIKPVNPKGNQSWTFIGKTGAEAEASKLWPHDAKSQLIRKDPDTGKDWGWRIGQQRVRRLDGIPAQWTWVWANSGRWWRKPGMLPSMGLQRVRHGLVTEQQNKTRCEIKSQENP